MENNEIIFGVHSVKEALDEGIDIDKIQINTASKSKLNDIIAVAKKLNIKISFVPHQKFKKYEHLNHQGIIAFGSAITYKDLEETVEGILSKTKNPCFLLLDGVTDVRNLGAIIRTAECTGVNAIIIPAQGSASVTKETVKTSAGAAYKLPIIKVSHLKDAIFYLQSSGVSIIGATEKGKTLICELDFKQPTALIMGSEGQGIQPSILKLLDHSARIPMVGELNSLNVSVACGMVLYESIRQKH